MGKLSKSLEEMGYQRNKYYWSVKKKTVKGKQYTILWHVYDLKMLHVDYNIVSSIFPDIDAEYRKITKTTIM